MPNTQVAYIVGIKHRSHIGQRGRLKGGMPHEAKAHHMDGGLGGNRPSTS